MMALQMDEIDYFREMSSSVLFDLLADDHIEYCDHSDARAAKTILEERNYTEEQIVIKVKQHKQRWYPKPYYFLSFLRWSTILSAMAMFVFNYGHINIGVHVVFEALTLAIIVCIGASRKLYRGTRYYFYQGFPAPMTLTEICTGMDFSSPLLVLIMGAVNVFTYANIFVFIYIVASFI